MRTEKENQIWYQQTFDEVHASEHLFRKVEAMSKEREGFKKILPRGAIAAVACGLLVFSNVISYAASGSPWILTITLPGGEIRQVETEPPSEGVQAADDGKDTEDCAAMDSAEVVVETLEEDSGYHLQKEGEHVYLVLDENCRVDIAEDLQDGNSKGTLDTEDGTWCYEVTGTPEEYEIQAYYITYNEN